LLIPSNIYQPCDINVLVNTYFPLHCPLKITYWIAKSTDSFPVMFDTTLLSNDVIVILQSLDPNDNYSFKLDNSSGWSD
jgi:hypothetical protein